MVESLPSTCEALGPIPSTGKKVLGWGCGQEQTLRSTETPTLPEHTCCAPSTACHFLSSSR